MDFATLILFICSTFTIFGLFSILTGIDNPFFAIAENLYVGGAVGLTITVSFAWIVTNVFTKIGGDPIKNWPIVIQLLLGLMMLFRLHPKTTYLARIPIAITTGVGIAISTRAIIWSGLLNQIKGTIVPIFTAADQWTAIKNLFIIIAVITILSFFIYTRELTGPLKSSSRVGRLLLFAAFGALYSQTYMGRLGLLLGVMDLQVKPAENLYITIAIIAMILIPTVLLYKYNPKLLKRLCP